MIRSKEGIDRSEYKLFPLLLAFPISFAVAEYLEFLSKRISSRGELIGIEEVPKSAILYGFHHDVMTNYMTMTRLAELTPDHLVRWIGFHGFFGYLTYHCGIHNRYLNIRYDRSKKSSARDQIVQLMSKTPDSRIGIFTDYGAPGQVRGSLAHLSIQSNRPVVPMRSIGDRVWRLPTGDQLPHLGTVVRSIFGKPIYPNELKRASPEEQISILQQGIENICP